MSLPWDWFADQKTTNEVKDTSGTSTGQTNTTGATTGATAANYNAWQPYGQNYLANLPSYWNTANSLVTTAAPPLSYGSDVAPLLSPFAGSQVAANFASTAIPEAQQRSYLRGSMSANPYASSNSGQNQLFEAQLAAQHGKTAQDIYGTSYQQALSTAEAEKQRLAGLAGTAGSLGTQQVNAAMGLIPLGGTTGAQAGTQQQAGTSSGTTTGHTTGTSTTLDQPSPASIVMGGIGALGKAFMPIPAWRGGTIRGYHSGGAIRDYDAGGAVSGPGMPLGGTSGGFGNPMPGMRPMMAPPPMMPQMGAPRMAMAPTPPMMPFAGQAGAPGPMPGAPGASPVPRMFAAGGAVGGHGGPPEFHGKVMHAFKAFHAMRKHAQDGGVMEGYDLGGEVGGDWGATVTPEPLSGPMSDPASDALINQAHYNQGQLDAGPKRPSAMQSFFGGLSDWGKGLQKQPAPASAQTPQSAPATPFSQANPALDALSRAMGAGRPAASGGVMRPGYADAGSVNPESDWTSVVERAPAESPITTGSLPTSAPASVTRSPGYGSAGDILSNLGYKPASKWDTLFTGLAATPRASGAPGPFSGVANAIMADREAQMKAAHLVESVGQATGQMPGGMQTLAGQKNPAEIAALQAHSEPAQMRIAEFKAKTDKDLAALEQLRKTESSIDDAQMYGAITEEEAQQRRQSARQLYLQTKSSIQNITAPSSPQAVPPPNATGTWAPGQGFKLAP